MQKKFEKDQKDLSRSRLLGSLQSSKESITSSCTSSKSNTSSTTLNSKDDIDSLETLKSIHCGALSKKYKTYEDEHLGNFSRIFPPENEELLDSFLNLLLYLYSLPNCKNSETITTKARKEYLLTKQSTQDLKLLKYQDWKKQLSSKNSIINSKPQSFSLDSILQNKPTKLVIKPNSTRTEKCKIGLRIQNITYPSGAFNL